MSLDAITHVWKTSKQKGSALLMMLALADYADENGECWPSLTTLAKKTRMTKRNVQKLLDKLEASGDITKLLGEGCDTRSGKTNRYRINMQGVNAGTSLENIGMNGATPVGVSGRSTVRVSHSSPRTVIKNPSIEPKEKEKKKTTISSKKKKATPRKKANRRKSWRQYSVSSAAAPADDEPTENHKDEIDTLLEGLRQLKHTSRRNGVRHARTIETA